MSSIGIIERVACARCGAPAEVHHVHRSWGTLRFSSSFRCASCGGAWEADGGEIPPDLRPEFLAHGVWALRARVQGAARVTAMRAVREVFGWSVAEAARRLPSGETAVLARGTQTEVDHWRDLLAARGVDADAVADGTGS